MEGQVIEEVVDIQKSYQWLDKAGLKESTEAQLWQHRKKLSARSIEAGVNHTR